jgi:cytochrome c oxidase subunit II
MLRRSTGSIGDDLRLRERISDNRRLVVGAAVLLFLALGGCARVAPQDTLQPEGEVAEKADQLWDITFLIAVVVFVIVEGLLVFALIRFRQRPGVEARQFHGNTKVEVILTAVPALILLGLAVPTVSTIMQQAEKPEGALEVTLVAHQFWWEYQYPELGIVSANELHIPTGRDVYISLEGATTDPVTGDNEVIHSYWVPRLAGTQDIIPGRTNTMRLNADEPGNYKGQCKEFCGLGHAYMRLEVIAETPEDFTEWVSEQQSTPEPPAAGTAGDGAKLFAEGAEGGSFANGPACASCHAVDANLNEDGTVPQPATGPNLAHFASRKTFAGAIFQNTEENLRAWLADPPGVKPGARMPDLGLTDDQINDLIAYLNTLK